MNRDVFATDRNKTLLVVEGKHEKSVLLQIILKCFPEIPVNYENILIFGADIYDLYGDIEEEYGEDWHVDDFLEINIPYLMSKRLQLSANLERNRFTNIILIFDYERHDPYFDFEKICRMQKHFVNASGDGILYLNYPMIESYLDMDMIPCESYRNSKMSLGMKSGYTYKNPVYKKSILWRYIKLYDNIQRDINAKLSGISAELREELLNSILSISSDIDLKMTIADRLKKYSDDDKAILFLKNSIAAKISNLGFLSDKTDYWHKMRWMLIYIIGENIIKTWLVQSGAKEISGASIKSMYDELDFRRVLEKQNETSYDQNSGFIWILNTCITFCGEYKFFWKYY